jgi:DNA primase
VIASSGTAFTEPQVRLLARFSKNIVVNFDPDTAGAAAAERSLALLVSEDFQVKILTLESGFDPDLYIRRKGADAYEEALRHSQKYFDYLIERARSQFATRTPEGKVKALNYLLPHIQRVPSRIVRDEWANEISHRLGIDSAVLRQELRHAVSSRSASRVKSSGGGLTDAERVLIRALATEGAGSTPVSSREGSDSEFEPARQTHFALTRERLHEESAAAGLIDALLLGCEQGLNPMSLPLEEADRSLLAAVLMDEHEEVTPELLESALRSLRKKRQGRELEQLQRRVKELESREDVMSRAQLAQEKLRLRRAMHSYQETAGA